MQTLYYDAPLSLGIVVISYGSTNSYYDSPLSRREDEDDEEEKICANISQNLLYCSSRYTSTYIGTPKFVTKALWVYSHLKSDFFWRKIY